MDRVFLLPGQVMTTVSSAAILRERGSTQHFRVFYDDSLGANGPSLADGVLGNAERDYSTLQGWFGGLTPASLPFVINIVPGESGASHASCPATALNCDAFTGTDTDLVRMLVVAEADEVFMAAQNQGWDCGASNGEGLSRVLATEIYPAELDGFASAASWLNSDRPDYVTQNDPTDLNYISIGCSTLFINYLRHQLGYSLNAIVQAAGTTLHETYHRLTGRTDSFGPFRDLLAQEFPPGQAVDLPSDNPFPIHIGDHFYTTSSAERDNAIAQYGYVSEGTAGYVFATRQPQTTDLYRLANSSTGDHFYTTSSAERDNAIAQYGYVSEGTACYVFGSQPGPTDLYRLVNSSTGDHFYTVSLEERDNAIAQYGYVAENIACYILATQQPQTTDLYRLLKKK